MQCPKCKASIDADSRFCGRCGRMIDKGSPFPPSAPAQPALAGAIPAAAMAGSTTADRASDAASLPRLLERIKNIVLQPRLEWLVIAPEPTSIAQLYTGYVMPLAAFAAVMSFLHTSVIGVSVPFAGVIRTPIGSGLTAAVFSFGLALLGLFLVGLIISALAPTFAGTGNRRQALKVAAYSFTPAWLSALLSLSPLLPMLLQWIALFYGIYVLYLGLPVLMRSPKERALGYTATVVVCTLLLGIVFLGISMVAGRFGWGPARMSTSPTAQAAAQDRGAKTVGNILGNALGTDEKGKAGLSAALSNLATAGQPGEPSSSLSATVANNSNSDAAAPSAASAVGGLVTALGGALGGSHRVEVINFKTLTAMLPESLPGMKRTNVKGENQGAVGVKTSSAKADYQSDNGADVHIEISDVSGVSGLLDVAGSLVQNTTSESTSGFERDQAIGGRSVHEKYDAKAKKGDLSVIVAKRFEVDVAGNEVDMNTLEQSLGQVDLARLESMKDQGSQAQ
jgi:Yip1 domain